MSEERDILKSLLLKEELDVLENLKNKLLSEEQFTSEVSKVLAAAIKRAQKQDRELERALSKPIQEGVKRAFSDNRQSIVDSMLPIMGQLIRKTVTNSIKQFVADINRTLELRFSIKSIRWRLQAKKAGITFAEMIFQKTISYKVKELFVINRGNGLLIQHVGANDLLIDNNAISAMLTAIQDFIGDSLLSAESGLLSAEIADNLILISTGPKAYLATVVKGSATERLRQKSQELIENIHADFSNLLTQENNYQNDANLEGYLRAHLITKSIYDKTKKINWAPWIIASILIFIWLLYWGYQRNQQYNQALNLVNTTPGLYLHSFTRKGSGFELKGLLDPMADVSKLERQNISIITNPFVSLDKQIIQKRVNSVLNNYPAVKAIVNESTVTVSGAISRQDETLILHQLERVIGIDNIDNQFSNNKSEEVNLYLLKHKTPQPQITYQEEPNTIVLPDERSFADDQLFQSHFSVKFPDIKIKDDDLNIIDSTENLVKLINSTKIPVHMQGFNNLELLKIIKSFQSLANRNAKTNILIIGESDCYGMLSDEYSQQRASRVKQAFVNQGVNDNLIDTTIKPCVDYNNAANQQDKRVSFKVEQHRS